MTSTSLIEALFSTTQQKVLGLLYGNPERSFYTNEISRWAQVGKGSLTRELERLHAAGILTLEKIGNQTHYQANRSCPIYPELVSIVSKTSGIIGQLRTALAPMSRQLNWAFIYGSIAKGTEHSDSDVDVLLIGENLNYADVMEHLLPVEEQVGRTINPTLYSRTDWLARKKAGNSFVVRVDAQDKIELFGHDPELQSNGHRSEP